MEQRLLLAFVLMGLVLFLTPYFYKAPPAASKTTHQPAPVRPPRRRRRQFADGSQDRP